MPASRPPANPLGQPPATAHRSPVTLQDLLDDLLWPHLLRSWKLALAPGRVALCFLLVLIMGTVVATYRGVSGHETFHTFTERVGRDVQSVFGLFSGPGAVEASAISAYDLFVRTPADLLTQHPAVALVWLPLILLTWCAVGGAVCRSCACEVALRAALPWRQAVRFGLRKSLALFTALAGPMALVWVACLLLKLFGLALFTTKVAGVLGSLLFFIPLILCLVVATACVAYLLAHSLLIPAVACEGTDSFDAVQRCYAYVLARPGRIVGYTIISLFATVPAVVVVTMIGIFAVLMAVTLTGAPFAGAEGVFASSAREGFPFSRGIVLVWIGLVLAIGLSYFISLYFCAATNLYLVVRRLIDGQDITELWTPPAAAAVIPAPSHLPSRTIPEKADYT